MSSPRTGDWVMLNQLAKYLKQHPRLVSHYAWKMSGPMTVYSDTDWAGCERTRRSTSGGAVLLEGALMRSWSSTQATVALSSAEAELQGMVKAAAEGIGPRGHGERHPKGAGWGGCADAGKAQPRMANDMTVPIYVYVIYV